MMKPQRLSEKKEEIHERTMNVYWNKIIHEKNRLYPSVIGVHFIYFLEMILVISSLHKVDVDTTDNSMEFFKSMNRIIFANISDLHLSSYLSIFRGQMFLQRYFLLTSFDLEPTNNIKDSQNITSNFR